VSGAQSLRLAPEFDRAGLAAQLDSTRHAYGSCRLGELIESDATTHTRYSLVCDRGRAELSLSLDEDRLTAATISPSNETACVP
jgi:hypothetical protein